MTNKQSTCPWRLWQVSVHSVDFLTSHSPMGEKKKETSRLKMTRGPIRKGQTHVDIFPVWNNTFNVVHKNNSMAALHLPMHEEERPRRTNGLPIVALPLELMPHGPCAKPEARHCGTCSLHWIVNWMVESNSNNSLYFRSLLL